MWAANLRFNVLTRDESDYSRLQYLWLLCNMSGRHSLRYDICSTTQAVLNLKLTPSQDSILAYSSYIYNLQKTTLRSMLSAFCIFYLLLSLFLTYHTL